jgi:uncharacterized protein
LEEFFINCYRILLKPFLAGSCCFDPSCSGYFLEALRKRGLFIGLFLFVRRILSCAFRKTYGYDPVPQTGWKNPWEKKRCCLTEKREND